MKNSYEKRNRWLSRAALWAAALTLIPITAAVAATPASVTIDLKEKALVEGAEVYLRDIGRILCTDPQASRTLARTRVPSRAKWARRSDAQASIRRL